MKINNYSFGSMVINNKKYDYDIIILNNQVIKWWRKKGHFMQLEDITSYIDIEKKKPEIMVIGKGYEGIMQVSDEVKKFIKDRKIELIIKKTRESVEVFNSENRKKIGFFHLTC
ncbi:hypothetical protein GF386_00290 [Candidatus Pacearchaeota archaeon]|nr:hypothetical protein [Candidatus Pacearchaeota archaeon]MBD3282721.1 hypothetical protein [Candidatus Pacearchaeota archaeon]